VYTFVYGTHNKNTFLHLTVKFLILLRLQ